MKDLKQTTIVAVLTLALMVPAFSGTYAQDIITIENGEITIESEDGESLIMIDGEGLEVLLSEALDGAMDGMQDVLAEMDEMQLQVRLGDDNQLRFETDDQMWEMNLDLVFKEIGHVLETAFDDVDADSWSSHHHFSDEMLDDDELEDELDRLKEELDRLREELNELKEI